MIWFLLAVLNSIFQAIFNELNRSFKIDSWQLNFLHCAFSTLLLLPILFFGMPSMSWKLVASSLVIASILTVGCQSQIYMAAKHNGRVGSMWRPISIFVAFVLWIGFFPETARGYMEDPLALSLILISFALIIFSIVLIRKNDIGWQALLIMAPVGVLYGAVAVLSKYILDPDQAVVQTLAFSLLVYFFMFLFSSAALIAKGKHSREMFSASNIKVGLAIGASSVIGYVLIVLAFVWSPNPAFASVVGSLSPVWIMVYHYYVGVRDDTSPLAGLVMIVASILLIVATI